MVWRLLGEILMELLAERGEFEEAERLRAEKYAHPLVEMAERTLSKMLAPQGGLTCPELEEALREAIRKNPHGLRAILSSVVDSYVNLARKKKRWLYAAR